MANIAIFRINYKSDFILTLNSDAGWMTPFCIKFWTGAPSQAYFVGFDGTTYTHCAPVDGEPTKLRVQFDDHHLPIGDLKFQIAYHFTVADFPTSVEDEVLNQASVIIEVDDAPAQVMLDFNGETAPEIEFSLPAYANEAQRIANEEERIEAEQQRIANEDARIAAEETRQQNEQQRINQETARVNEFATLKSQSQAATRDANDAATLANQKAQLAADKAALADDAATLANQKAQLAADKAALANDAAQLANAKAALAQQKAEYAQQQGGYAKDQGDYAKNQGNYAKEQGDTALADHQRAEADHGIAVDDHTQAGNDHTRAESDHGIAVDDHTQAGNDHTRAESDHGIAVDDHTQAGNDHTRAESDHGIAADDHTQAGNDHTRAESDHTRAESDHAAVEVYVDSLGVFDLSKHNAVGGVLATYADLSAAITALNTLDSKYKYGGMSFKFVLSSDNKYEQFRYMSSSTTVADFTNVANWQGVDDKPTAGSLNFVESGGVYNAIALSKWSPNELLLKLARKSVYVDKEYQMIEKLSEVIYEQMPEGAVVMPFINIDGFVVEIEVYNMYDEIYYTLDGTEPTQSNGTLYIRSFEPTKDCMIKAVAVAQDGHMSQVNSVGYTARETDYIVFDDPLLAAMAVTPTTEIVTAASGNTYNGLGWHSGDGYMTKREAANIISLPSFADNTDLKSFRELKYFTELTDIPQLCFDGCINLEYIELPNTITSLINFCFRGCTKLRQIELPASVHIVNGAFSNSGLEYLRFPQNALLQGTAQSSAIKKCVIEEGCSFVTGYDFKNCANLETLIIKYGPTEIKSELCRNATKLKNVLLPYSATSIGNRAFQNTGIEKIILPDNITEIGKYALGDCSHLVSVKFSKNIKTIGESAFMGSVYLVDFELPEGLETIGAHAFRAKISEREYVTIPSTVTSIGDYAFDNTNNWRNYNVYCQTPPTISANTFGNAVVSIHIPAGTMNAYLADPIWATLSNKLVADL